MQIHLEWHILCPTTSCAIRCEQYWGACQRWEEMEWLSPGLGAASHSPQHCVCLQQIKREFNPTVHLMIQRHLAGHCTFCTWVNHLGSLNCVFKGLPSLDSHKIGVCCLFTVSRAMLLQLHFVACRESGRALPALTRGSWNPPLMGHTECVFLP